MQTTLTPPYDAIVAGAGPVGLFLACELKLAGCSVLVLERAQESHSPLKGFPFGARGLSVSTVESLERRGLFDALAERSTRREEVASAEHRAEPTPRPAGHFAGIEFFHEQLDTARWTYRLPEPVSNFATDMASIEAVLVARAMELAVEIRRGCDVDAVEQSGDEVVVGVGDESFRGRWLIGCDGGRSLVRRAAGFAFDGTEPEFTGYFAQVTLAEPHALRPGRQRTPTGMYLYTPPGIVAFVDFDEGAFHRTELITAAHIEQALCKVSGVNVTVTSLQLATTWTDRAFQATEYRKERVLLAGDAAHVHSPLGGQGLNLGLGDAMNLGWKLAAVIHGNAPIVLLDSYGLERQPVGMQVLDWSRAQVALMRPTPSARAQEDIIRDLAATQDGATYFAERVWGIGIKYELGDNHALVGRSSPNFNLVNGTRLNQHLREGKGLLLDFNARSSLSALAARWNGRLNYVAMDVENRLGLNAIFVRPDGVVAWVSDSTTDPESASLAISHWLGEGGTHELGGIAPWIV